MSTLLRLLSLNTARLIFVGSLLLALYAGLTWALSPEERPDADAINAVADAREAEASEAAASEAAASEADATPTPSASAVASPQPTVEQTRSPAQLIAEALPPAETRVQVLDAGGGGAAVDEAVAALETIGYQVIAITSARSDVAATTILYVDEHQPEAEALRARDPRFQEVGANQGFNADVEIHVLVGPGF